jgi:hypothetical protein
MESMSENTIKPSPLRLAAAVILGIVVGFFLFLIITLGIGLFNDMLGTALPVSTNFAENIYSAVILVVLLLVCIGGCVWLVWKTPPTPEEE